jgi:hypothetical protein
VKVGTKEYTLNAAERLRLQWKSLQLQPHFTCGRKWNSVCIFCSGRKMNLSLYPKLSGFRKVLIKFMCVGSSAVFVLNVFEVSIRCEINKPFPCSGFIWKWISRKQHNLYIRTASVKELCLLIRGYGIWAGYNI